MTADERVYLKRVYYKKNSFPGKEEGNLCKKLYNLIRKFLKIQRIFKCQGFRPEVAPGFDPVINQSLCIINKK